MSTTKKNTKDYIEVVISEDIEIRDKVKNTKDGKLETKPNWKLIIGITGLIVIIIIALVIGLSLGLTKKNAQKGAMTMPKESDVIVKWRLPLGDYTKIETEDEKKAFLDECTTIFKEAEIKCVDAEKGSIVISVMHETNALSLSDLEKIVEEKMESVDAIYGHLTKFTHNYSHLEPEGVQEYLDNINKPPTAEESAIFKLNTVVRLKGLKTEFYNGKVGTIVQFVEDTKRYKVYIKELKEYKLFKPINFDVVSTPEPQRMKKVEGHENKQGIQIMFTDDIPANFNITIKAKDNKDELISKQDFVTEGLEKYVFYVIENILEAKTIEVWTTDPKYSYFFFPFEADQIRLKENQFEVSGIKVSMENVEALKKFLYQTNFRNEAERKKLYKAMALKFHPDKNKDNTESTAITKVLTEFNSIKSIKDWIKFFDPKLWAQYFGNN